MKLTIQHRNLRSTYELDSAVEEGILSLQRRFHIDEANVRLECRYEASPAFCARIHLVTPGPDVIAEDRDHTVRAAIDKVMAELDARIGDRMIKQRRRTRGTLQEPKRLRPARSRA